MYREVKASERLPNHLDVYYIPGGMAIYDPSKGEWVDYSGSDKKLNPSFWLEPIDITKIIEEIEDLHPYKQSGDRDSYSDYSQGWADACDVVLSRLEN